jgi:AraC-like DNA-binding protein
MKPELEYLPRELERSFNTKVMDVPYYPVPWHYHPEFEIKLVTNSTGKRFIGDRIDDFKPGNLALIGPLLPHLYRNGREYYSGSRLRAKAIVVHFAKNTFGDNFLSVPETAALNQLFAKSTRGLGIVGETNKIVSNKLFELLELSGFMRWLKLLEILHVIAESDECHFISNSIMTGKSEVESQRLNKVIEYVMNNFAEDIYISDAANLINMAENSFSRYFSRQTGKTFASFVTEIRLSHASKLLIDDTINISEIGFKCGFNNLSNFNRQFSKIYNLNPQTYRKQYWNKI